MGLQEALLKKMAADLKQRLRDERKAAKAAAAAAAKAAAELDPDYDSEDDVANAAEDEEEEEEEEEPGLLTFNFLSPTVSDVFPIYRGRR